MNNRLSDNSTVSNKIDESTSELVAKVPQVTLIFWIVKVMSTTVGETGADYLAVHVGLGIAITDGIMFVLLVTALLAQLRVHQYVPWKYWLAVVLVSVVGTQITDFLTDKLEISLYVSTAAFACARVLDGFLFDVTAHDPVVFASVPLLLTAVAFVAIWLPSQLASRVNPVVALRSE